MIDIKLAKFFFSSSIAFKAVENEYFLDFVNSLCDIDFTYTPPCRQTLASSILLKVNGEIEKVQKTMFDGTNSVILVDGWKNKTVNRKYLVFSLRNLNLTQSFLCYYDFSVKREFGEVLAEHINSAIQLAQEKFNTNVIAIINDNDYKICRGARLAKTIDGKDLIQTTCSSHSGNLLLKSLVSQEVEKTVKNLLAAFKDTKLEYLLVQAGGTRLKSFPDTRFCYFRDTCKSILDNLRHLQYLATSEDIFLEENLVTLILDESFKQELLHVVNVLNPICKLINACQEPHCTLADATEMWLTLECNDENFQSNFSERFRKAIHPAGFASNLLHNVYQGQNLNEEEREIALNFIKNYTDDETVTEFTNYQSQKDQFTKYAKNCSAAAYWALCKMYFPKLSRLALDLMIIPASTAELEGLFSKWTYIHTVYRNRLGDIKSSLLLNIYQSLRTIPYIYQEM